MSDEDKLKYDNNNSGDGFIFMIVNHAVVFYPNPSWGLHMVGKFKGGKQRPFSKVDWVNYEEKENRNWGNEVPESAKY